MIRSPYTIHRKPLPPTNTREAVLSLHQLGQLTDELNALKAQISAEHEAKLAEIDTAHGEAMARIEAKIAEAHAHIKTIAKGDPGEKGATVVGPPGPAGKDATVDEAKIVERVLARVPAPKDGAPGQDGIHADPEAVVALIQEKKLLKAEHIAGLPEELASYRNQLAGQHYGSTTMARGGGDTIAAGTGISITNANGVKTIVATGGAGFSTLAATETPDGSTTVFTFATATAQPSYLVVDNVWMKATTAAGTVNWTWNGGTKKATLTIAPVDDIWGVV